MLGVQARARAPSRVAIHHSPSLPVVSKYFGTFTMLQTANIAREIEGVQTDVLLQAFADRILVLVTQLGKVGSLVSFALCKRSPMDC